jgi:[acyl-carrier-protein] S-malonyltransferase
MLAVLVPGQGAQKAGMLTPWLALDGARERLSCWSSAAGLDLEYVGTSSSADITDTAVAQPLLTAAALLSAELLATLAGTPGLAPARVIAGHSVGELGAASLAGVLARADAVRLARVRGLAMAAAAERTPTGMAAVVGGNRPEVLERIAAAGATVANVNGARQVVAAGTAAQLARLAADARLGAQVVPLAVAGAFHTGHMAPAGPAVQNAIAAMTLHDPDRVLLSNADGGVLASGAELGRRLVTQICGPVRWDLCMDTMRAIGVTAVIELFPGGTLTGLLKRELLGVELLALRTPRDLGAAVQLLHRHAGDVSPVWPVHPLPV